jgi:four helix bundle protein
MDVMGVADYKQLTVWQLADALRREVYRLLNLPRAGRDFKFRNQLTDAVSGIPSNLAEGFRRDSPLDFARFVGYAFSAIAEVAERLEDGEIRGYWSADDLAGVRRLFRRIDRALANLLIYLQSPEAQENAKRARRRRLDVASSRRQRTRNPSEPS